MDERKKSERRSFSETMIEILNAGAVNLALAIGYRTGLLDVLDTFDSPRPAAHIAEKAGLSERYVREWLGIVTGAGIVTLVEEDGENLFQLPTEHGDLLTRRAGSSNLGVYTQEIPLLTAIALDPVIQGFYTGEGVGYECYPRFQAFMSSLAEAKHQQVLIDRFLPSFENGRIVGLLRKGIRVCDLGCGEGVATILMAEAYPESRFTGLDISKEALDRAAASAREKGLGNIRFLEADAARLDDHKDLSEAFEYVTAFDSIHDQTHPLEALKGVQRLLVPGGIFSMVDIAARTNVKDNLDHPMAPFLYTVSLMHCMPVGLVNGGAGLGMMWGREKAEAMLREVGFLEIEVLEMDHDPFNLHFCCRK
ncbi:MAG: class I SAM-dependent methyltransferase [Syntrophobacteraceae bacterium]